MPDSAQVLPPAESSDSRSLVRLVVSGPQLRVSRIAVAADWRDRATAESLAEAVLEAALSPQFTSISKRLGVENDSAGTVLTGAVPESSGKGLPDIDAIGWEELGTMLDGVRRAMSKLDTVLAAPLVSTSVSTIGADRHRIVEVSLAGGQPSSVSIDPARAARAGRQGLSDALNQAFEEAYAQYDRKNDAETSSDYDGVPGTLAEVMRDMQSIVARVTGINSGRENRTEGR